MAGTGRKLKVDRDGDFAHLAGAFGVFDVGTLELAWANPSGPVGKTIPLAPVNPLSAVVLDRAERIPAAATRIQLLVSTAGTSRLLADSPVG